jgi:hypothetical protein
METRMTTKIHACRPLVCIQMYLRRLFSMAALD